MGPEFDLDDEGDLLLGREAGHRRRRIVHADGDATGAEVMRALTEATDASDTVEVLDRMARAVDLARPPGIGSSGWSPPTSGAPGHLSPRR
jgi:aspartate oxidase